MGKPEEPAELTPIRMDADALEYERRCQQWGGSLPLTLELLPPDWQPPSDLAPPTTVAYLARQFGGRLAWRIVLDAYLDAGCDSPATARAYRRHVTDALTWIGADTLVDVSGADLAAWRAHLLADGRGPASHGQALAALRSFLAWSRPLGAHHLAPEAVRVALRSPKGTVMRPYQTLAEVEVADLLAAAETPRDRALLAVLLGAGLRAAEAAGLDVSDLVEAEGGAALHVRRGKGRRDRVVPIRAEVAAALRAYLAASGRAMGDSGPLFRSHDRGAARRERTRISTRTVGDVVARVMGASGIAAKRISPHSLRHTYALRALRHGGNVVAVSKLLGHAAITTTSRYLDHLELAELRAVVPELPRPVQGGKR